MVASSGLNLLFVHEVSYLDKVVFEMHDFPELLAGAGHRVWFVDFPEGRVRRGGRRILDLRTEVTRGVNRSHHGGEVDVYTPGRGLPPPFDRPSSQLTHRIAIARLIREQKTDAVVLYGVPTNGWATIRAAKAAGVPVLFRSIDVSHLLRRTRLSPLIRRAERYVVRNADWISTHNDALRRYLVAEGADPARISIERPGMDLRRFAPVDANDHTRSELGFSPEDRVAVFMGTLYRFAGLDWMIRDLSPYLRRQSHRKLMIVGDGEEGASLRRLADKVAPPGSVVFTGKVDYDRLPAVLGAADVAVNPFDESPVTHCALPGKMLQYMAMGLPSVTTPLDGLRSVVGDASGIRFAPAGPRFASAVSDLLDDPIMGDRVGADARRAAEEIFSWPGCLAAFGDRLTSVIDAARAHG